MQISSINSFKEIAKLQLSKDVFDYIAGGAGDEVSKKENIRAFKDLKLFPRVLTGENKINTNVKILDHELNVPLLISPTAFHKLVCYEGEISTAKAAAKAGTIYIASMASNTPIEEVVKAYLSESKTNANVWQQLYIQPDNEFNLEFINRIENAGCSGIVITIDSPVFGKRERDIANNFLDLPEGLESVHLKENQFKLNTSWADIQKIIELTNLPVIVKGILHPLDAIKAIEVGCSGIIVSNHGGRQLDTVPATIEVLPSIVDAVKKRIPIILDGGIRKGTDVLKALCLGANAVSVGRPILWALASGGEISLNLYFEKITEEIENSIALLGAFSVEKLNPNFIFNRSALYADK